MYSLIPAIFILLSLAGIFVILMRKGEAIRALPPLEGVETPNGSGNGTQARVQQFLLEHLEKLLRRAKLAVLKAENSLSGVLHRVVRKRVQVTNGNGNGEREKPPEPVLPEPSVEATFADESLLLERIKTNPKDVEAYQALAVFYERQGNTADAQEVWKMVKKLGRPSRRKKVI
ncbi:tetratricopeptide repeat protein [Candidatus Azambacteria bacterium]|nr:tetratricopeptide repeat protein [Candidatus Azambacteria bacterium]